MSLFDFQFKNGFIICPNPGTNTDKDNKTNIYTANLALWRSDNSTASSVSWSNLGTFDGANSGNELTIAPSNNKVMYVGVGNGKLYKILNPELGP